MAVKIDIDPHDLAMLESDLDGVKNGAKRAIATAVRKTAASIKSRLLKRLTKVLAIKRKEIDGNKITDRQARERGSVSVIQLNEGAALVKVTGQRLRLYQFVTPSNADPVDTKGVKYGPKNKRRRDKRKRRPAGRKVRYRIKKTGGKKVFAEAFIAEMKSGHRGVFFRSAEKRMESKPHKAALVEAMGPSLRKVAEADDQVNAIIEKEAPAELAKQLASQVDRLLGRSKGGA